MSISDISKKLYISRVQLIKWANGEISCSADACTAPPSRSGLCRLHEERFQSKGRLDKPSLREYVDSKLIRTPDGHWLWPTKRGRSKEPLVHIPRSNRVIQIPDGYKPGDRFLLREFVYLEFVGPQPYAFRYMTTCGEISCVAPDHVRVVESRKGYESDKVLSCSICNQLKPASNFYAVNKKSSDGSYAVRLHTYCKPCAASYTREHNLRTKFGITSEIYDSLFKSQGGVCAICSKPPKEGTRLHVDHDHKSLEIRGLLCAFCNHRLLGYMRDDSKLLRSAATYLENSRTGLLAPAKKKR